MRRAIHIKAVKMQRGGLIAQAVVGIDNDLVSNAPENGGNGPLAIDADNWALELAIWVGSHPTDVEVILNCCC